MGEVHGVVLSDVRAACLTFVVVILTATHSAATGPVAYYPFNGSTDDASGWGNHAVNMGALPTEDRHGNPAAAYLVGDFGRLEAADSDSLDVTDAFALAAWFRFDEIDSTFGILLGKGMNTGYSFSVYSDGSFVCPDPGALRQIQVTVGGGSNRFTSGPVFDCGTGEWHHVAVVFVPNGGTGLDISLYADGSFAGTTGVGCLAAPNTAPLGIGIDSEISDFFSGALDDLRIFDRELSAAEVVNLYNSLFIDGLESGSVSSWTSATP